MNIKNYFNSGQTNIEGIEFTSGTVWSNADVAARAALATVTRNTAPVARNDSYAFSGGKSVTVPVAALLDNDRDSDGDALLITQLSNVTGGTAVLNGHGGVIITRTSDSADAVTFDYTISDGHGGKSSASFSMSLPNQSATNQAPRIISKSLTPTIEDRTATGRITATDSDGDTLIYTLKEGAGPGKGHVVIKGDGSFTYTPVANANGPDAFTISVSDGTNAPVDAQVSFTIAAVNDKPVAKADSGFVVKAGHTLKFAPSTLLKK